MQMALSDSDRALLQLLIEGDQDYLQASALLGVSASDAADRSRSALASLSPSAQALPPPVSDWLLGQADPIVQADAIAAIRNDDEMRRRTVAAASALRLVFPSARIPEVPSAEPSVPEQDTPRRVPTGGANRSARTSPPTDPPPAPDVEPSSVYRGAVTEKPPLASRVSERISGLSGALRRNPRAAILGGALSVLVLAIVLGVTLLGGKDGEESQKPGGTATLVPLAAVDTGSSASGQAVVVAAEGAAIAQVEIKGLEPTSADQSYVLWLYRNPEQAYPLARDVVGETGKLSGPAPVPRGLDPPYGTYGCLELTLASKTEIEAGLRRVAKQGTGPAVGQSILRGEISPADRDPRSGSASVCDPDARD